MRKSRCITLHLHKIWAPLQTIRKRFKYKTLCRGNRRLSILMSTPCYLVTCCQTSVHYKFNVSLNAFFDKEALVRIILFCRLIASCDCWVPCPWYIIQEVSPISVMNIAFQVLSYFGVDSYCLLRIFKYCGRQLRNLLPNPRLGLTFVCIPTTPSPSPLNVSWTQQPASNKLNIAKVMGCPFLIRKTDFLSCSLSLSLTLPFRFLVLMIQTVMWAALWRGSLDSPPLPPHRGKGTEGELQPTANEKLIRSIQSPQALILPTANKRAWKQVLPQSSLEWGHSLGWQSDCSWRTPAKPAQSPHPQERRDHEVI